MSGNYTIDRLSQNWFWPSMSSDADNYCKACHQCAKIKAPHSYTCMPLQALLPTAFEFGDRLHIDMLSMPTSVKGHITILTAVDAATGFIFAKPCFDKTSKNVTELLLNTILPYFGAPKMIVMDLRVENKNADVAKLLSYFNIKHIFSSRTHPQSNGMVKRRQRMLLNFGIYVYQYTNCS